MSAQHRHWSRTVATVGRLLLLSVLAACSTSGSPSTAASIAAPTGPEPASVAPGNDPASVLLTADVDVGGRKVHVSCLGTAAAGVPTVVFESGLGAGAEAWNPVFYGVAAMTRVCAYDRAGLGASDPATGKPPTTEDQVADLHAALAGAKVSGPYVLGSHSLGAWNISLYTSSYPDDVLGLVFVDPRGPGVSAKWLAAMPPATSSEPDAIAANRDELTTGESDPSLNPEGMDLRTSEDQAIKVLTADGQLFADRPVIVLGGGRTKDSWADLPADVRKAFDAIWLDEQKALAAESTRGTFKSVPESSHDLMGEFPEEVVQAVKDVLAQVGA